MAVQVAHHAGGVHRGLGRRMAADRQGAAGPHHAAGVVLLDTSSAAPLSPAAVTRPQLVFCGCPVHDVDAMLRHSFCNWPRLWM